MKYTRQVLMNRLLPKIRFTDNCWIWIGAVSGGYGNMRWNGRHYQAHVLVYKFLVGNYSNALVLNHLCENTRCVNPNHLEPTTKSDNSKYSNRFCINGHNMDIEGRLSNRHGCALCYPERQREYKKGCKSQVRVL